MSPRYSSVTACWLPRNSWRKQLCRNCRMLIGCDASVLNSRLDWRFTFAMLIHYAVALSQKLLRTIVCALYGLEAPSVVPLLSPTKAQPCVPLIFTMLQQPFLTHWGQDEIDAIPQTTFSNAFSWMKMNECRLGFHWSLFLRFELTIFPHWFR